LLAEPGGEEHSLASTGQTARAQIVPVSQIGDTMNRGALLLVIAALAAMLGVLLYQAD
jgi:hypothetical protein